jgi:hypothetical protein
MIASEHAIRFSALEINRKYLIVESQYVLTKYGPAVLLRIKDKPYYITKFFIPKLYIRVLFLKKIQIL